MSLDLKTLRSLADIGRTQGVTATGSVAIAGALSSTASVTWYHIVCFTLIAGLLHTALNTYIALGDLTLDAQTYVPSRNPVISGELSIGAAKRYIYLSTALGFMFVPLFFIGTRPQASSLAPAYICVALAYLWLVWYGYKGKKILLSYDCAFSFSYAFWALFGVFAVGGRPTVYTWLFIAGVVFAATAFAQWENGLKDVDADRFAGVRSFAVMTNVHSYHRLRLTHPYALYGIGLKAAFLFACVLAAAEAADIWYSAFVLAYGIPSQAFIMYRFLTMRRPIDHRKTILLDVTLAGILLFSLIFGRTGALPIIILAFYLVLGYLAGSALQAQCEFKFARFGRAKRLS